MGLRINSNVAGLEAQRQTAQTARNVQRGFEGLASALRLNRARDDAAGLAIAEGFRADVRQFNQEINNIQSGVNFVQTTEGGLEAQQGAVSRLNELAVQAANGTLTDEQRGAINEEAQQLLQEIDATANNTEFNGVNPLNGSVGGPIDLGTEGDLQVEVQESTVNALGLNGLDLGTQAGAQAAIDATRDAQTAISQNRASLGAQQNRFESAIETRQTQAVNATASESAIRDLDYARAVVEQTRNQILLRGGLAAIGNSNIVPQTASRLLGL